LCIQVAALEKVRRRYSITAKEEQDRRLRGELVLKAETEALKQAQYCLNKV
jgi:hypothetical protein